MLKKIFNFLRKKSNIATLKKRVLWVGGYAVRYWKEMLFYTILGLSGTALSLISSFCDNLLKMKKLFVGQRAAGLMSLGKTLGLMN